MSDNDLVIIGVGDVVNRSREIQDAVEVIQLMEEAIKNALDDTGVQGDNRQSLIDCIDSLDVVNTWTWTYDNLPKQLAQRLNIRCKHLYNSSDGGNQPIKLLDQLCRRIADGQSTVGIVTGGEALASLAACAAAGQMPPPKWPQGAPNSPLGAMNGKGVKHKMGLPTQVYPLYEHGFRALRKQSPAENNKESAELYAGTARHCAQYFDSIKAQSYDLYTINADPMLMNAFNNVNLAAAFIVTSVATARQLGIPSEKLIYVLGAAGTSDQDEFWRRPNFTSSPAIEQSVDAALASAGCRPDDIDLYDFYSCFPIVPKLACQHLGLPLLDGPKPITLLGGLTSFGGAGNSYSTHATTAMVRALRSGRGRTGLVLANGGVLSYQHAAVLSSHPRRHSDKAGYPRSKSLPDYTSEKGPAYIEEANGNAVIETYTVEFGRNGKPETAFVVGRLQQTSERFIAHHADDATLSFLAKDDRERIGLRGAVVCVEGLNRFSLENSAKL